MWLKVDLVEAGLLFVVESVVHIALTLPLPHCVVFYARAILYSCVDFVGSYAIETQEFEE
jgi:hypothetical protein